MAPSDGCTYAIRVQRHLGPAAAALFPGLEARHEADGSTILTGDLPDQAALHGVLARVRDLGLVLLEVRRVEAVADPAEADPAEAGAA